MNIIKVDRNNQVNGDGLRCVIWCSGCEHKCPGCHNPETWNYRLGSMAEEDYMEVIMEQLQSKEVSGITLTGGDPLFPRNREGMTELCHTIKFLFPDKTIWCYTGYLFEEVKDLPIMDFIDILIDGRYEADKNPGIGKVLWRGSTNQRIIDVQESLNEGKTILYTQHI